MLGKIRHVLRDPVPIRFIALRWLDRRLNLFTYTTKLDICSIERPYYGHGLLQAATLAAKLGHKAISAVEFGVAGGNGLVNLEMHAEHVKRETGVEVAIYGFDTGSGMPPPLDHRDMPYMWQAGYFAMDQDKLRARLRNAKLVIGKVEETLKTFCGEERPPPIGFISFDVDYYSSTMAAFEIFSIDHRHILPRVACYLDDMVGDIDYAYHEFAGELLAVDDFNAAHEDIKIAPVRGMRFYGQRLPQGWHEQMFVAHLFRHPDYNRPTSALTQLHLASAEPASP